MFIDEVVITTRAGKGGDGIISWRKEKYIPKWGPYGGDGGRGGNIILQATTHETTLVNFRHMKLIRAEDGERGGIKVMHGRDGKDTILDVPIGTIVTDTEDGTILADLSTQWEQFVLCEGGRGWFGNAHFCSSTRQAPNFAELGDAGEERTVKLELKLVADIALVWLPNAGKSTLIQSITNVRPKIADYAFTTLIPNLGVMEHKWRSIVVEDVPGLIEGASEWKGLGFQFLKHIERCRVIIHLLDASQWEEAIVENYTTIRSELEKWSSEMAEKEELILLSKKDIVDEEMLEEMKAYFEKKTRKKIFLSISAGAYMGIDELKDLLIERIPETKYTPPRILEDEEGYLTEQLETPNSTGVKTYDLKRKSDPKRCTITRREDGDFEVTGERIEEITRMTDIRYIDGVNRVYDVMEKLGVIRKIKLLVQNDMLTGATGFFEGEEDIPSPHVYIAGKKFSLENIIFMKWSGRPE